MENLTTMTENVVKFQKRSSGHQVRGGSTIFDRLSGRFREAFGWGLGRLKIPGAVRDAKIKDALTGQEVEVHVGRLFTRFSVNGRDYFFHRLTGKFDGTGVGCN